MAHWVGIGRQPPRVGF